MLLISIPHETRAGERTLRLEGQIAGRWVRELARACAGATRGAAAAPARVTIDMSFVSFIDDAGIKLLHALRSQGVEFANVSPFAAELMKEVERAAR